MPESKQETEKADSDSLLEIVHGEANAQILAQSEAIGRQVHAIRQLEAIMEQVDAPFIGTYLTA